MASEVPPIRGTKKKKKVRFTEGSCRTEKKTAEVTPEVRSKIYDRVAREERAYRIVERMIDNPVSVDLLQKSLKYINQATYNDIVEERAIVRNCGYPVCLANLPKTRSCQTYKIDRAVNKVYKLEERNKFCSGACFTCSRELRDQLSPEPVWLIPPSLHKSVTVIPVSSSLIAGRTGEGIPENQKIDAKYIIEDRDFASVKHQNIYSGDPNAFVKNAPPIHQPVSSIDDIAAVLEKQFSWLDNNDEEDDYPPSGSPSIKLSVTLQSIVSFTEKISIILTEWITSSTREYLKTLNNPKIRDLDSDDDSDSGDSLLDDDLRLSPRTGSNSTVTAQLPVPHISDLSDTELDIRDTDTTSTCVSLPKVDSLHGRQQRSDIVQSKVQAAVEWLFNQHPVGYSNLSGTLVGLLTTFNLTKDNCVVSEKLTRGMTAVLLLSLYPAISDVITCAASSREEFVTMLSERCDISRSDLVNLSQLL